MAEDGCRIAVGGVPCRNHAPRRGNASVTRGVELENAAKAEERKCGAEDGGQASHGSITFIFGLQLDDEPFGTVVCDCVLFSVKMSIDD